MAKGLYVLEFEGEVYPRKSRRAREREYASNEEGCYILDAQTREGWICIDSTRRLFSPSVQPWEANKLMSRVPM